MHFYRSIGDPLSIVVLLAEDDDELRDLIQRALESDGAKVISVADGEAATKVLASAGHLDVLVTDVRMPARSGTDVLRDLRRTGSRLPVIVITGFGDAIATADVDELGSTAVLEKPFDVDDLRTALRNLARLRHP